MGVPSVQGSAVSPQQQTALAVNLQKAVTAAASNGTQPGVDGFKSLWLEVVENNVGAATLTTEGSTDNINWFPIWAAPTAANGRTYAATFAITQNTRTYLVLQDSAPYVRARLSANTGSVTINLYGTPI